MSWRLCSGLQEPDLTADHESSEITGTCECRKCSDPHIMQRHTVCAPTVCIAFPYCICCKFLSNDVRLKG